MKITRATRTIRTMSWCSKPSGKQDLDVGEGMKGKSLNLCAQYSIRPLPLPLIFYTAYNVHSMRQLCRHYTSTMT